ncbi:uncharacterized protein LOC110006685 isoform X2 [Amborella trichopoda]|uniref:Uncharacterized protein n=1 Tax=Amborella trichopoda TaxID=13333 RepID=W1NVI7_AMBTC|nr:uncharacterized protein LOC110006685 isoform X2 [Amborella trichopoda]ERM99348.1 hypothetical protein AMTR_s00108p00119790 [Amborella trichopoda]|eukprot:XP_020518768.1 uncharacterized protein LOC110006685 isoform X2 [Amborella trichopoda]
MVTEPIVTKKGTRLSKRAASSPSAPPLTPPTLRKGTDAPPRLEKRAKTQTSTSSILPSVVANPAQEVIAETNAAQTSAPDRGSENIPPPSVEIEAYPTENIIEGVSVPSPSRSSLSQGDFFCTITEEGDILEAEIIEEVVILAASGPVTSEVEPRPAASSIARLELIAVAASEASSLMP